MEIPSAMPASKCFIVAPSMTKNKIDGDENESAPYTTLKNINTDLLPDLSSIPNTLIKKAAMHISVSMKISEPKSTIVLNP